jgi:hypothetical protein
MNTILPTTVILSAVTVTYIFVKAAAKPVVVVVLVACLCLVLATFIIVHKGDVIAQKGNSGGTLNYCDVPSAISREDEKFLDDLLQEQNQENQQQTNPVGKLTQHVANSGSDSKPVPRAELIINTTEVKRAQLVINSQVVKRAELVRPREQ